MQTLESRADTWDLELSKKVDNVVYNAGIQNLGNQINLKANKSDLNSYATKAQLSVESDRITQQASAISSVTAIANGANSKIDNLSFGGRNLLDRSDGQFVMGYGITNTTWENGKATLVYNHNYSKTNKSSEILPQAGSRNQWYRVNKDEELTQSIIVETDATYNPNGVYEFTWFTSEFRHRPITANIDVLGTNKYRLWCSFKWDKDQSCNMRIFDIFHLTNVLQINTSGTYISFYHPQIERGNKPSDWGMSDNDINQKISDANASITKTNETIKTVDGNVTTVKNNLDKTKSVVTQLANLFDVTVGDSSISVTNNGVLVKGKQIHIDGQTVIDNASIDGAKIKSLDAGKITTGTLEGVTLKSVNSSGSLVNIGNGIIKFGYETGGRGAEFGQINAYNDGLMLSGQDPQYTGIYLPNSIDSAIGFYTNRDGSTGYNNGIGIQGNTIGRITISPRVNQPHVSSPILSFEDSTLRLNVGNHGLTINGKLELGNNYIFSTDEFSIDNPAGVFRPVGWRFWGNALNTHGQDLWVNSYEGSGGNAVVHARGFANTSLLSKKTDITKVTTDEALSAIRDTEIYSYYYIDDLKKGKSKRYASYVIDDVNTIKQYHEPDIFLSEDGTGRDDGTQLAYVTVATQYLLKQNQTVSEFTNTGENGTVKVLINAQDANYRVNLTPYGNGYAWVDERNEDYFIVKSNVRNLEVLYEIRGV